jgi:hypothetical protein
MSDSALKQIEIPVYGTLVVYPNGTRAEGESKQFDTPGVASIGRDDWYGFQFGAMADVIDDDLKQLADAIAPFPNLRDISIGGCGQVTDRGLGCITRFEKLEDLCMNSLRKVSNRGLNQLERLRRLVKLNMEWVNNVNDGTARTLSGLSRLESLNLNQCPNLTDAGIEHLTKLTALTGLGVNDSQVTDRGITSVAKKLRRLQGFQPGRHITDRGLAALSELPELNYLTLPNCAGFLRRLIAGGISRKGLDQFQHAKPDCDIWSPEIHEATQRMIAAAMNSSD